MAAQVVKEDLLIITLLLLVVNMDVAPWWKKKALTEKGWEVKAIFGLLTVNNHVVSNDGGRVEGSFSRACCWETGTKRCPEPPVHVEYISVVHPHAEPENVNEQNSQKEPDTQINESQTRISIRDLAVVGLWPP